jgi:hypothetical protein
LQIRLCRSHSALGFGESFELQEEGKKKKEKKGAPDDWCEEAVQ